MQPASDDRLVMYANGVRASVAVTGLLPTLGEPLVLGPTEHLCIANRFVGDRTPIGHIGYAAYYTVALTQDEVTANVARPAISDDR